MSGLVLYDQMMDQFSQIRQGDIVYVVSDVLKLALAFREAGLKLDLNQLLDSISKKVGQEGTVLIPTFNWDFCKGKTFDYYKTPSKTGALGNAALKRTDYRRTKHPIYSFAVWGRDQDLLCGRDDQDSFGKESVFAYMHRNRAKALVIGLPTMSGLTFCHYVEQQVGVPFRFMKYFTAGYIDENGTESEKTYSMYVRDLDINAQTIDNCLPLGKILEQLGVSRNYEINGVEFHVVDLAEMFEVESIDIRLNDCGNMYHYRHDIQKQL